MKAAKFRVFASCMVLLGTGSVFAEGEHGESHGESHSFHPNVFGVFAGVTSETRREGSFTLGLEYHRRFNESFGVGVVAEHVFADHDFNVVAIPFSWYLGRWKLFAGPGFEKSEHHDREFLARAGVEYAIPVGRIEISPQVMVDFVDGDSVLVFGLTFGKGF